MYGIGTYCIVDVRKFDLLDRWQSQKSSAITLRERRPETRGVDQERLTDLPVQVHLGIPVARQFKSNFLESF